MSDEELSFAALFVSSAIAACFAEVLLFSQIPPPIN
jgi:hypothetical protein